MQKQAYQNADAMAVARRWRDALTPFTTRIQIVGSLRRLKPTVGDCEVLFIPKTEPSGLFGETVLDLASEFLTKERDAGNLTVRHGWGPKNKFAVDVQSGIPIDFFSTSLENWWVALVVKTGSADTCLKLTNGALALNRSLLAGGPGVSTTKGTIFAKSEDDVFRLCGVPFLPPEKR